MKIGRIALRMDRKILTKTVSGNFLSDGTTSKQNAIVAHSLFVLDDMTVSAKRSDHPESPQERIAIRFFKGCAKLKFSELQ